MAFILADRTQVPARIALTGPTNAGKTLTAIYLAIGMVQASHPDFTLQEVFKKIALIDTERGRGKFYANRTDLPFETSQFYYMEIQAPYTSNKYVEAVKSADKLVGPTGVIIVDSLSHAWNYEGGILDRKNQKDLGGGNSYTNWASFTTEHNQMINTILSTKANFIGTMRSKMDYVMEANVQGKMAPKKVGLKPVQRDDTEYEFDITLMLDAEHTATIIKDTTVLSQYADPTGNIGMITPELGTIITKWLNQGVDPKILIEESRLKNIEVIKELARNNPNAKVVYTTFFKGIKSDDLTFDQTKEALSKMQDV